jgi:hypothetical protein
VLAIIIGWLGLVQKTREDGKIPGNISCYERLCNILLGNKPLDCFR